MKTANIVIATFLTLAALMSGCANTANTDSRPVYSSSHPGVAYGVVDSIEMTRGSGGGPGAGAVIGGVVGGVLGHQVGSGTGKDVATVAGVVGGAVAGHQIEKGNKQQDESRIRVRLDNGGYLTVTQQGNTDFRVGDRVRIENDHLSRD